MCSTYKSTDEFGDKMPKSESSGIITSYDEDDMGKFLYHLINNTCKKIISLILKNLYLI